MEIWQNFKFNTNYKMINENKIEFMPLEPLWSYSQLISQINRNPLFFKNLKCFNRIKQLLTKSWLQTSHSWPITGGHSCKNSFCKEVPKSMKHVYWRVKIKSNLEPQNPLVKELNYLIVQSMRKTQQRPIKAAHRAKQLNVMVQESQTQAVRLYLWTEGHMVLVEDPLRTGNESEEVCRQADLTAACPW